MRFSLCNGRSPESTGLHSASTLDRDGSALGSGRTEVTSRQAASESRTTGSRRFSKVFGCMGRSKGTRDSLSGGVEGTDSNLNSNPIPDRSDRPTNDQPATEELKNAYASVKLSAVKSCSSVSDDNTPVPPKDAEHIDGVLLHAPQENVAVDGSSVADRTKDSDEEVLYEESGGSGPSDADSTEEFAAEVSATGESDAAGGPCDPDSTESETDQLRRSLAAAKQELENTRENYLAEKEEVEYKEKNLVKLAIQFSGMLKALQERDVEVQHLLRESSNAYDEIDQLQQQEDLKAEVDMMRKEVETHNAEIAKILKERATEREQKEKEVQKLKAEVVSLQVQVSGSHESSNNISGEEQEKPEIEVELQVVENRGELDGQGADVEVRGTEESNAAFKSSTPTSPASKEHEEKDENKQIAAREGQRKETPMSFKTPERQIAKASTQRKEATVSTPGRSNSRRNRPSRSVPPTLSPSSSRSISSPRSPRSMSSPRSVSSRRSAYSSRYSNQRRETKEEFYERLHRYETESLRRKRSDDSGLWSDADSISTNGSLRSARSSRRRNQGIISPVNSGGLSSKSGLQSSPDSVLDWTPSSPYLPSKLHNLPNIDS